MYQRKRYFVCLFCSVSWMSSTYFYIYILYVKKLQSALSYTARVACGAYLQVQLIYTRVAWCDGHTPSLEGAPWRNVGLWFSTLASLPYSLAAAKKNAFGHFPNVYNERRANRRVSNAVAASKGRHFRAPPRFPPPSWRALYSVALSRKMESTMVMVINARNTRYFWLWTLFCNFVVTLTITHFPARRDHKFRGYGMNVIRYVRTIRVSVFVFYISCFIILYTTLFLRIISF